MDNNAASKFINSIIKNLQLLCHSDVNFNENIEIIGHLYLNVDSNSKYNYFVNEKVCKNDESSTVFVSNSFHAEPVKKVTVIEGLNNDDQQCSNINKDVRKNKFSELRQRKAERIKCGIPQIMNTYSDDTFMSPAKQSRLTLDTLSASRLKLTPDKYVKPEFEQFNINSSVSYSSDDNIHAPRVHVDNPKKESSLPYLSPSSHSSDKLNSNSCSIDLTKIKSEPTDEDMDYIRKQQNILEQSVGGQSYITDDESLSTFSGSNEQLNMYSSSINQNEAQSTSSLNNFPHISLSGLAENSTHKLLFPPLPPAGPGLSSSVMGREDMSNVEVTNYKVIYDDKGCSRYACSECAAILSTKSSYMRHFNEKHLNIGYMCTFCGHKFTQRTSLRRHVINVHEGKDAAETLD